MTYDEVSHSLCNFLNLKNCNFALSFFLLFFKIENELDNEQAIDYPDGPGGVNLAEHC